MSASYAREEMIMFGVAVDVLLYLVVGAGALVGCVAVLLALGAGLEAIFSASLPGCCDSCRGTGVSGDAAVPGGLCWDCRATGHAHPAGRCKAGGL